MRSVRVNKREEMELSEDLHFTSFPITSLKNRWSTTWRSRKVGLHVQCTCTCIYMYTLICIVILHVYKQLLPLLNSSLFDL